MNPSEAFPACQFVVSVGPQFLIRGGTTPASLYHKLRLLSAAEGPGHGMGWEAQLPAPLVQRQRQSPRVEKAEESEQAHKNVGPRHGDGPRSPPIQFPQRRLRQQQIPVKKAFRIPVLT